MRPPLSTETSAAPTPGIEPGNSPSEGDGFSNSLGGNQSLRTVRSVGVEPTLPGLSFRCLLPLGYERVETVHAAGFEPALDGF